MCREGSIGVHQRLCPVDNFARERINPAVAVHHFLENIGIHQNHEIGSASGTDSRSICRTEPTGSAMLANAATADKRSRWLASPYWARQAVRTSSRQGSAAV